MLALRHPLETIFISLILGFCLIVRVFPSVRGLTSAPELVFSNALTYDLGAKLLFFLVLINLWSCLLAEFCIQPKKTFFLRRLICRLGAISVCFFSEISFLKFYIYFELSLVPIFLIIIGWGYQIERVSAAKAIILYTIIGSLPLLGVVLRRGGIAQDLLFLKGGRRYDRRVLRIFRGLAYLAFLIKLPIFFCHIWLPKAHVEAPVVGSMFLAAILLKLGGYGLIKIKLFLEINFVGTACLGSVALWSLVFVGALCSQATDIKVLIAFSSVAHISFVILTLRRQLKMATACALLVLVSHGVSSSAAFFFRFLIYKKRQTRSILLNKGGNLSLGLSMLFWGLICLGVIGAPPTFNLWVEICSLIIIILQIERSIKLLFWGILLGGVYRFFLIATPISFNSQFLYLSNIGASRINLIHLIQITFFLISARVLCPIALF